MIRFIGVSQKEKALSINMSYKNDLYIHKTINMLAILIDYNSFVLNEIFLGTSLNLVILIYAIKCNDL